jgi:type IV pilus assembly protein PilV
VRNSQNGFTLLEILIAMLIIAVGVLGHAKMQVKSMDIGQRAGFAQTANLALLDLSQRIRVNPQAALANEFNFTNLTTGIAPTTTVDCGNAPCTTHAQFAQYEVKEWFDDLNAQLPLPRFSVGRVGNLVTITLVWDAARTGIASGVCNLNSGNYQCGSLTVWLR